MKIIFKPIKYLLGYGYLLLLLVGGAILGSYFTYKGFNNHHFNEGFFISFVYSVLCIFLSWYSYTLLKCSHYIIELNEKMFKHKILFTKEYTYMEIKDIYVLELRSRSGPMYILKIIIKTKTIRLRLDKLSSNDFSGLIDLMKIKTRRRFISYKNKSYNAFPLI